MTKVLMLVLASLGRNITHSLQQFIYVLFARFFFWSVHIISAPDEVYIMIVWHFSNYVMQFSCPNRLPIAAKLSQTKAYLKPIN